MSARQVPRSASLRVGAFWCCSIPNLQVKDRPLGADPEEWDCAELC